MSFDADNGLGELNTTTTRIDQIHLVVVPSTDQDRSIAFYESLGFEKRVDAPFGDGHRWIEIHPPSGPTGIALAPATPNAAGVQTGIIVTTSDIDTTHAELQAAGIDVDPAVAREGARRQSPSAPSTLSDRRRRCSTSATQTATRCSSSSRRADGGR